MNIINVEVYSIVILLVLILNYISKFKNKLNVASLLWLALATSTLLISISNIIFSVTDVFAIEYISLVMYLMSALTGSLFVYVYVKYVYINMNFDIKKEMLYILISILLCIIISFVYVYTSGTYVLDSFERGFFNKLLMFAIVPNIVICIQYIYNMLKDNKKINIKLIITLLITIIALFLDVLNTSLFFVSATFTLTTMIIYINKHETLLDTDPLTGLSNKRSLGVFIENLKPGLTLAVYSMDIDRFKQINDKYGHLKGDYVLKKVAEILRNSSRDRDLAIRNGGDEFLIISVISKKEDANIILGRINDNLEKYNKNAEIKVGVSIGWGAYKTTETTSLQTFEKFLKCIDKKMYAEKEKAHKKLDI